MLTENNSCIRTQGLIDFFQQNFQGAPKGIIFDCDGVLVDSVEANMLYYNGIRRELGLPELNASQREYCQMSTGSQALDLIVPDNLKHLLPDVLKKVSYNRDIQHRITVSDNLPALVHKFYGRLKLAVHTNRSCGVVDLFEDLKLDDIFDPIMTAGNAEPKPDPDGTLQILKKWNFSPKEVLFIGDSRADKEAANAALVPFLSYRNPQLLEIGTLCDFNDLSEALSFFL